MKTAITISLVEEARGGPFVLWDGIPDSCRKAREFGFDAVEVFAGDASVFQHESFQRSLTENGLALAAAGTGAGWVRSKLTLIDQNSVNRQRAIDFVKSIIDAVAPWQAHVIIGSMQGRADNNADVVRARGDLAVSLSVLSDYANAAGCLLLIEPLNRYETNLINTVADGLQLIQAVGSTNLKLLCDLFHMNIEERGISEALQQAGTLVGHIHFVDSNRRAAGLGHLDYVPIARALRYIGYEGYLSAEAVPLPNADEACRGTIAAFQKYLCLA